MQGMPQREVPPYEPMQAALPLTNQKRAAVANATAALFKYIAAAIIRARVTSCRA